MISFCKSSFHSILGIADSDYRPHPSNWWGHILSDCPKTTFLAETPAGRPTACEDKPADPGSWGLHEASVDGGGMDLCTESLGSESCDIRIEIDAGRDSALGMRKKHAQRPSMKRIKEVQFPPPLSWMREPGGRTRFLKAERMDGRLVLTEIQIDRPPDMLRAIRIDGRLRLELVRSKQNSAVDFLEETEDLPKSGNSTGVMVPDENDERWELPLVRNEGHRCVEAMSNGLMRRCGGLIVS